MRADEWPGQPANPTHEDGRPSRYNWFGTNEDGVDVFAQMVHGTTIALLVGFVSMGIATALGITLGAIGGFAGGTVDMLISRITEVVLCIPTLVLILALLAVVEHPSIWHMMVVIGCTGWTNIARLTRAEFLRLKQMDFVAAAQCTRSRMAADRLSPHPAQRAHARARADCLRRRVGHSDRGQPELLGIRHAASQPELGNAAQRRGARTATSGG